MGLQTDRVFVKALRSNGTLMGLLAAGDVYNTAIALPDEEAENAPLPYVIVSYDGMTAGGSTKDSEYEAVEDVVRVGITIAARTRPELAGIAEMVRSTVRLYFAEHAGDVGDDDWDLIPGDMGLSAQGVQWDGLKPCFWQVLEYECRVEV